MHVWEKIIHMAWAGPSRRGRPQSFPQGGLLGGFGDLQTAKQAKEILVPHDIDTCYISVIDHDVRL